MRCDHRRCNCKTSNLQTEENANKGHIGYIVPADDSGHILKGHSAVSTAPGEQAVYTAFLVLAMGVTGQIAGVIVGSFGYSAMFLYRSGAAGCGFVISLSSRAAGTSFAENARSIGNRRSKVGVVIDDAVLQYS